MIQCDLDGVPEVSLSLSTKRGICELTTAAHASIQDTVPGQHRIAFSPPANQFTLCNYEVCKYVIVTHCMTLGSLQNLSILCPCVDSIR